ncbi:Crp/Fnr family transcriptional regulator [Muribaculum intestinale]|uniref:Crp/Fnr family transcriptional regulator n=1 Tax=Muribaculum intestinale TaxID=1796646 RepID=UPI0025A5C6CF|nr:hypothetical protein [Muribaculum intestinale]
MPHPIDILRKLHNFPDEIIGRVQELMVDEHVRKGYCIESLRPTPGGTAFYIKKGAARTFYIDKGREYTLSFAFDDDFIITNTLTGIGPGVPMNVMFLEDSDIVTFVHSEMHQTIHEGISDVSPLEWTMFLNAILYEYAGYLEERLFNLYNASARERYEWVLRRYPRLGEVATTTQIASFLGITKETLYRIRGGKYSAR